MKSRLVILWNFLSLSFLFGEPLSLPVALAPEYRLNGSSIGNALGQTKDDILRSIVGLYRNERLIAHGVIVDPRGFLLTKASSSVGARIIKSCQNESFPIRIRKRDEVTDLALWEIVSSSASSWNSATWDEESNVTGLGSWAFSASASLEGIGLGVISATSRPIGREGGVMGVLLGETNSSSHGIEVLEVLPQAAGDRAGLKISDRIIRVDGRPVKNTGQINRVLQNKDPGDLLTVVVNRKDNEVVLRITLGHQAVAFDLFNRNLIMSGPVSKRKDNFSLILQHDLPVTKEMMGGGLFNLQGHCLGINIARVDRVTNYTLPSNVVLPVLNKWLDLLP